MGADRQRLQTMQQPKRQPHAARSRHVVSSAWFPPACADRHGILSCAASPGRSGWCSEGVAGPAITYSRFLCHFSASPAPSRKTVSPISARTRSLLLSLPFTSSSSILSNSANQNLSGSGQQDIRALHHQMPSNILK